MKDAILNATGITIALCLIIVGSVFLLGVAAASPLIRWLLSLEVNPPKMLTAALGVVAAVLISVLWLAGYLH
jgi:hypothetical protein